MSSETNAARFTRIRKQGYLRTDPVSFSIAPRDGGCVFNAEEHVPDGLLEFTCSKVRDLLHHLFGNYPAILEKYYLISDNPAYPQTTPKQDFLFVPDRTPQEHQEPFILIEHLNFDTDDQELKCFESLHHFLSTFAHNIDTDNSNS